jgi:hypothetical protein
VAKVGLGRSVLVHAVIGGLIGYLVLHPMSQVIKDTDTHPHLFHWEAILESFTVSHVPMAAYYMLLGVAFGAAIGWYAEQIRRKATTIRVLEGLLPICAWCKRIRDDTSTEYGKGEWVPLEAFISAKSEADFTHGICPVCLKKLGTEFAPDDRGSAHRRAP